MESFDTMDFLLRARGLVERFVASELGIVVVALAAVLLICVGAVSTMRWCDDGIRSWSARRASRARMRQWIAAPPVTPARHSAHPANNALGPRTW